MEVLWLSRDDPDVRQELIAEIEAEVAEKGNDYPLNRPPKERILSFDSYNRGALMMYALHEEVGDDAFFEGLRIFLARYGGENAGQDDFQEVMETAAGYSLENFFDDWLED
jgi:aminopeptidase N